MKISHLPFPRKLPSFTRTKSKSQTLKNPLFFFLFLFFLSFPFFFFFWFVMHFDYLFSPSKRFLLSFPSSSSIFCLFLPFWLSKQSFPSTFLPSSSFTFIFAFISSLIPLAGVYFNLFFIFIFFFFLFDSHGQTSLLPICGIFTRLSYFSFFKWFIFRNSWEISSGFI